MEGVHTFLDGHVTLYPGDGLTMLKGLAADSVDSCVTDPPYHLTSIVRRFGSPSATPCKVGATGVYARGARGFMGQTWDGGDIAFRVELWAEVLRVLKPGGHVLAFSATRTHHRMACAIEDAGFEIRDMAAWMYGSGFPKSHDVAKGIGKRHGADDASVPASGRAAPWEGWGTALKPALEPICLARKPLIGTVAETVLAHGTGGLNIDGCRIEGLEGKAYTVNRFKPGATLNAEGGNWRPEDAACAVFHGRTKGGRWPANVIHDGSDEVIAAFPDAPGQLRTVTGEERARRTLNTFGDFAGSRHGAHPRGDSGSAARFFYSAKADAEDRLGSNHPTVKPLDLMQWLVRLVTPKGGLVLDCFAGTGTTGEAAVREGMRAVLIEREAAYCADIARRMALVRAGPMARRAASVRTRVATDGPLFDTPVPQEPAS